jgi:nitroreductase
MDLLDPLTRRRSVPSRQLGEPGPTEAQTLALLSAALRVPDHGKLAPWRFLTIRSDARRVLGERLAARALALDPAAPAAAIEKDRQRFNFAPLVVAVIATPVEGHKVPVVEQLMSGGAVCFSLLQAAQGLGFGAQWLTGWAAYDRVILEGLGLAAHEQLLGFIHIGTPSGEVPERLRPTLDSKLSDWAP